MTEIPQDNYPNPSDDAYEELFNSLLKKEGNWVEWGEICQKLQKVGYSSQVIFEKTGFQASQQNLIIVAAAVYESIKAAGANEEILKYYLGPKSDVLYSFRVLNRERRLGAANLAKEKKLDAEEAKTVAKAIIEFDRLSQPPIGFSDDPADAVAYQYWRKARQKKELVERAGLIAKGLKYASSREAREKIEQLLGDISNSVPSKTAPLMPIYRLEQQEELPRIIPVVRSWPKTKDDIKKLTKLVYEEPFGLVGASDNETIAVPGWKVILSAEDPVGIVTLSDRLPKKIPGKPELLLVVVDRSYSGWDDKSYFLVEEGEELKIDWFETAPELTIIGQIILIMRAKKIIDENNITEPWQMDD